jgi:DNA-binding beta-propeller fold protein YncE
LAAIEREVADPSFLVVGVHSPKFPGQRDPEMVRAALARLGVTHPVVLDPGLEIMRAFAVRGWPTMVFVDPRGSVAGVGRGEPEPQALLNAVRQALGQARSQGVLTREPLPLRPEPAESRRLAYPGGVATLGDGGVVVADTGHHQVVVCDAGGRERHRIGSGRPGSRDGPRDAAELRDPHGLAVAGGILYIADTGNHALRAVDLARGEVATLRAGAAPLLSPWGLAWDGRRLHVAAAGLHQIWAYDPASGALALLAGTGVEGGRDGDAPSAWFAQPSGLAIGRAPSGAALYVADSETSSIREVTGLDRGPGGSARGLYVRTVCGSDDLFGFGDRDGAGAAAALQHPLGVAAGDGAVYVADTFNHKLRSVDPATGSCRTLFGGGGAEVDRGMPPGGGLAPAAPGAPAFCEPEDLAWRDGELLVADTGNHRVLAVRVRDGARRILIGG